MNEINKKIYLIALTEVLINNHNKTDLGEYQLEYLTDFDEIGRDEMYCGDACLVVAVRLKNKKTGVVEWGNTYCKRLVRNSTVIREEDRPIVKQALKDILKSSDEEKMAFILRPETKILKRPYLKLSSITGKVITFFNELSHNSPDGPFPYVTLNGHFPKKVMPTLDNVFVSTIKDGLITTHKGKKK